MRGAGDNTIETRGAGAPLPNGDPSQQSCAEAVAFAVLDAGGDGQAMTCAPSPDAFASTSPSPVAGSAPPLMPGQQAFFGAEESSPMPGDAFAVPAPAVVRFIVDAAGRLRPMPEQQGGTPESMTAAAIARYGQWSIENTSSTVVDEGVAALARLERASSMTAAELGALPDATIERFADDLARVEKAAREITLMGTDYGVYPEKALEAAINRAHELSRLSGGKPFTLEASVIGINMTDVNAKDHSYRTGDALRDAATKVADELWGFDISSHPHDPRSVNDSVTRFKNTNVVLIGVGGEELAAKGATYQQRLLQEMKAQASRRKLPVQDFAAVDLSSHAYAAKVEIAPTDMAPGVLETKLARFIAELSAGEGFAGKLKKADATAGAFFVSPQQLPPEAVEAAGKEAYFLFHAPSLETAGDICDIAPMEPVGDRPPLEISADEIREGKLMRRSHRFGRLVGMARDLRASFGELLGAIRLPRGDRMERILEARDHLRAAFSAPDGSGTPMAEWLAADAELAKYNYRFSENGKGGFFVLKPQYLGEKVAEVGAALRAKAGPNAEVRFHVFFTELKKAGDYFATHKASLSDDGYRMTLEIPLKGFAQQGMADGAQTVLGGDEAIWVRCEVVRGKGEAAFTPEAVAATAKLIAAEFERIHAPRPFQPSEKTPFAGGKYRGIRFGLGPDRTLYLERPTSKTKDAAVIAKTAGDPAFAEFLRRAFGVDLAGTVNDPASGVAVEVVGDLAKLGAVGRHKMWVTGDAKGGDAAYLFLKPGVVPEGLSPVKATLGVNIAKGTTSDPRDLNLIIARLGEKVSQSKATGEALVDMGELSFWEKAQTRPGHRLMAGGASWFAGELISNAVVGGVRYLATGQAGELAHFVDPKAYAQMALGFVTMAATSKAGELSARAFVEKVVEGGELFERTSKGLRLKPGFFSRGLTPFEQAGVHGTALLAAIMLPQALSGEMSAEGAAEALMGVGLAMGASRLILGGLRAAQLISAESGVGLLLSAGIEFTVIKGFAALEERRRIGARQRELQADAARAMQQLDGAIAALEADPRDAERKAQAGAAYKAFNDASQQYLSFLELFRTPEGEALLAAREAKMQAEQAWSEAQAVSPQQVYEESLGGLDRRRPTNVRKLSQLRKKQSGVYDRQLAEAEAALAKSGQELYATLAAKASALITAGSPEAFAIDAALWDEPEPKAAEVLLVDGPCGRIGTQAIGGRRPEHPYRAQVSDDPSRFYVQSMIFAQERLAKMLTLLPPREVGELILSHLPEDSLSRLIYKSAVETISKQ